MGKLRVAVTGDTGFDIYTEYAKGYQSDTVRVRKPEAAHDIEVPSGAKFTARVFRNLLGSCIDVDHLEPEKVKADPEHERTLQKMLIELSRFKSPSERSTSLRVRRTRPVEDKSVPCPPTVFNKLVLDNSSKPIKPDRFDLLVIHDGAGTWRRYPQRRDPVAQGAMAILETLIHKSVKPYPQILVNLCHDLPPVIGSASGAVRFPKDLTFWNRLQDAKDHVCVVCSAGILRLEGAAISRRLSWEQTVSDLMSDIRQFDKLRLLAEFKHLIVRFGVSAAIHITRTDDHQRVANVVFAPFAKGGIYRDPIEDGEMNDENVFLLAGLAQEIASQNGRTFTSESVIQAMRRGLLSCMLTFDAGYELSWSRDAREVGLKDLGPRLIDRVCIRARPAFQVRKRLTRADRHKHILGDARVPREVTEAGDANWEILRNSIIEMADPFSSSEHVTNSMRINLGMAIVLLGNKAVLNCDWTGRLKDRVRDILLRPVFQHVADEIPDYEMLPEDQLPTTPTQSSAIVHLPSADILPVYVPMMTFGRLTVVERKEIESLRSIRNLLKTYQEHCGRMGGLVPPISIAVFGPPGSGKSFAVKEIASDINGGSDAGRQFEPIEYNVSQFRSVEDLGEAVTRAGVANNEGRIPLVFFDEFDCDFERNPLGWLKYFLAPMQDGVFYGVKQTIKIARAVFVFAGGINPSFDDFDPSTQPPDTEGVKARLLLFKNQKGRDFVSRLRGYINILPVNGTRPRQLKPIIRRAIILRGLLERAGYVTPLDGHELAGIDEDLLYAMLTLDEYRHGTRSMQAVLDMCAPIDDRIEKASLPSRAQLKMHIDADAFFIRMNRGRLLQSHYRMGREAIAPQVAPMASERTRSRSNPSGRRGKVAGDVAAVAAKQGTIASPKNELRSKKAFH